MVNRLGKVDEGTTVTDFDEEAIARKHTLAASVAFVEWNKTKINLIDTPGFANFFSDARAALRVADAALVVVDGVAGVEVQTEKAWEAAAALGLPRLVVLNRFDRERANLERALQSLRDSLSRAIVPIQIPIGQEKAFTGVVDLIAMKAYRFQPDGSGKLTEGAVPAELSDEAQAARDALIEMVAEADDSLMEKFFEAGTLTQDELESGLRAAVSAGRVFPLLLTSAIVNVGVQPLLDAIVTCVPPASEVKVKALDNQGAEVSFDASDTGPYALFVWKTIADPFAGRINLFRVMRGTIKPDATVYNVTKDAPERLGHLLVLQGKTQTATPELKAGDLGAVAKLKDTGTNDTLADKGTAVRFPPTTFPEPVLAYAIEPKTPRRRRQDQHRHAPSDRRRSEHSLQPRSADQGAAPLRTRPAAHRGHGGEAEAAIRRRGEPQAAAHPVPRDDRGSDRSARAPQETDRRPRAVRRLQDQGGTAVARGRLRVRR